MNALWFAIAAVMVAAYVVLDGFDFGAGALHLAVARSDAERRQVLAAIGPFWDGNEVWLLAAGGVLFLAFPKVLAAGLSGFYLAIFLVLWVLILRGVSIELRSHVEDPMWRSLWDAAFTVASALAPVLLGAALGNVLRGVPLDPDGWFALPLFASFSPTGALGVLDWYSVLVGVIALVALLHHGALFLAWKTDGVVRLRSLTWAARLFPATVVLWVAATAATARVAPRVFDGFEDKPLVWLSSLLLVVGLVASFAGRRLGRDLVAFLGSSAFLLGTLAAIAASVYPTWLPAAGDPGRSLTAFNAASSPEALRVGLYWWPLGLLLALVYFATLFYLHRGKAKAAAEGEGY
jgi:cytochrome bd ubiquinol oxidase subunit II